VHLKRYTDGTVRSFLYVRQCALMFANRMVLHGFQRVILFTSVMLCSHYNHKVMISLGNSKSVGGLASRGFEPHPLRQQGKGPGRGLFYLSEYSGMKPSERESSAICTAHITACVLILMRLFLLICIHARIPGIPVSTCPRCCFHQCARRHPAE
jgi:hypothetical protein